MRKLFALFLILALMLSTMASVLAEEPKPRTDLESWLRKNVGENEPMDFTALPLDQIPPIVEGQHHYLLLCIDQWNSKPRPDGIEPPTGPTGQRRDLYGNTDGIVILTLDTAAHRIMMTSIVRDAAILKSNSTEDKQ